MREIVSEKNLMSYLKGLKTQHPYGKNELLLAMDIVDKYYDDYINFLMEKKEKENGNQFV